MIDDPVRLDTRLAGQVKRYHTWPIVGQQSVAEHTWQILRIYLSVAEKPDPHLMSYIIFHDIGEHFTGDIPYPVKQDNPELKAQMEMLELRSYATQVDHWRSFHQSFVTPNEKILFKQIELVEMAEFGMDQIAFGNAHGFIIANRCLKAVFKTTPPLRLAEYVSRRLRIFFEQCPAVHVGFDLDEDWWYPARWEKLHAVNATLDVSGTDIE